MQTTMNLTEYVIVETLKKNPLLKKFHPNNLSMLARELTVVVTLRHRSKEARAIIEERYKK